MCRASAPIADATRCQHLLDDAEAEGETEIQPEGVADGHCREAAASASAQLSLGQAPLTRQDGIHHLASAPDPGGCLYGRAKRRRDRGSVPESPRYTSLMRGWKR